MAVTAGGSPYVESSDLVANYPGASLALANRVDQVMQAPTQNAITSTTYTAALLDAGKTVTLNNAAAVTLTIPAQATVAWAANTQLNFLNIGAGTVTITPAATVTINGTPLTLNTSQGGSLVRTASNTWTFIPAGAGGKVLQVVSAATTTNFATTSTAFVDFTGVTLNITPTSATSKIVVWINAPRSFAPGAQWASEMQIMRNTTALYSPSVASAPAGNAQGESLIFQDSPNTTSSTTYKAQVRSQTGTSINFNAGSVTVMEVSA